MGSFLQNDLQHVAYIIVEVELFRQPVEKIMGLFLGYRPIVGEDTQIAAKDELFLWLAKGEQIHVISLDHYKVTTIDIGIKPPNAGVTIRSFCTSSWAKSSIDGELEALHGEMVRRKWMLDTNLIDIDKYHDMPAVVKAKVEAKSLPATANTSGYSRSGAYSCGSDYWNQGHPVTPYKKKEVTTSSFKRTSRYNVESAIASMSQKIAELKTGTYKPPKLKEVESPEGKKTLKSVQASQVDSSVETEEDYNNMCCMD